MHRRWKGTVIVLALTAMVVLVAACSVEPPSRVTKENYDQLKLGMTLEAVMEILGAAPYHSKRLGVQQYTWADGERHIHAKFIAGRAIYYSSKGLDEAAQPAATGSTGH